MISVIPLFPADAFFDAEARQAVGLAFDRLCLRLGCNGEPALIKPVISAHLLALAGQGELDPDRMYAATLVAFGIPYDVPPFFDDPLDEWWPAGGQPIEALKNVPTF